MPILQNARHETMAKALADGKSAAQAYEGAGFKPNRHNAARLARDEHIRTRVHELIAERETIHREGVKRAIELTGITKQWVLDRMKENAEIALGLKKITLTIVPRGASSPVELEVTARDAAAANRALELLGREVNAFIEKKEIGQPGDFDRMSDEELAEFVRTEAAALGKGMH